MRRLLFITALLALSACGKSEAPPAQSAAPQPAPAVATAPANAVETAAAAETAVAAPDAVTAPTWTPPADGAVPAATAVETAANGAEAAPVPAAESAPEPAPAETPATAPAIAPAPETQAATAPVEAPAPAPVENAPADAPYQVVDGRIDARTVEGWKVYRGIGTCATCHGPVGQGGVGPALVESLRERITKELFVETVTNGRDGTMMKPFGENAIVMENLDNIYAYLKARADGVLGPENLIKYPLGKIE